MLQSDYNVDWEQNVTRALPFMLTGNMERVYVRRGGNGTLPCLPAEQAGRIFRLEWLKEDRKLVQVSLGSISSTCCTNTFAATSSLLLPYFLVINILLRGEQRGARAERRVR